SGRGTDRRDSVSRDFRRVPRRRRRGHPARKGGTDEYRQIGRNDSRGGRPGGGRRSGADGRRYRLRFRRRHGRDHRGHVHGHPGFGHGHGQRDRRNRHGHARHHG